MSEDVVFITRKSEDDKVKAFDFKGWARAFVIYFVFFSSVLSILFGVFMLAMYLATNHVILFVFFMVGLFSAICALSGGLR